MSAYESLCELAEARGWRVAIHEASPEDALDGECFRLLAVWDRSPAKDDANLLESLVIPDCESLDWTATQLLANLRVRP